MKYVAFDLATSGKDASGTFCDICCAVTYHSEDGYKFWYTKEAGSEAPANVMTAEDKTALISYLVAAACTDHQIYGWGTQMFDFPRLYAETNDVSVINLANVHIDFQFGMLDAEGWKLPLGNVARYLKMEYDCSLSKQVPARWLSGEISDKRLVLSHVKRSVAIVARLVEDLEFEIASEFVPLLGSQDAQGVSEHYGYTYDQVGRIAANYAHIKPHALKEPFVNALEWMGVWA